MSRTRDKSKSWTGPRRFVYSCKNHGSCRYCSEGREHATRRRVLEPAKEQLSGQLVKLNIIPGYELGVWGLNPQQATILSMRGARAAVS